MQSARIFLISELISKMNISNDVEGKSAFTQWEHNIVAGYLITAGKMKDTHTQTCTHTVYIVFKNG